MSITILDNLRNGEIETCFQKFYDNSADMNASIIDGKYPLHIVCDAAQAHDPIKKEYRCLAYDLLRHRSYVNVRDGQGRTPMHYAASYSLHRFIELFNYFEADLTVRDNDGDTVLHSVAVSGNLIALALLLKLVIKQCPELLDTTNNKKKRFNDLFRSTDQVLLYNRFKVLNKLSSPRNQIQQYLKLIERGKLKDDSSPGQMLYAMMALDDIASVRTILNAKESKKRSELKSNLCDNDVVLGLSAKMNDIIKAYIHHRRVQDLRKFLYFFSFQDGSILTEDLFQRAVYYALSGASRSEFSMLNYFITLNDETEVKRVLQRMRQYDKSLKQTDIKLLKKLYPNLAVEYAPHTGHFIAEDLSLLEDSCPICREPYALGDKCFKLSCKHQFHEECLFAWKPIQYTCPMCRKYLNLPLRDSNSDPYY